MIMVDYCLELRNTTAVRRSLNLTFETKTKCNHTAVSRKKETRPAAWNGSLVACRPDPYCCTT